MLCNYVLTTKLCCVIATITMREGLNSKMRTPSKHINEEAITGRFHAAFNNAPSSLFLFNSEVRKNITYTSMITSCYTFRVSARAKVCSESNKCSASTKRLQRCPLVRRCVVKESFFCSSPNPRQCPLVRR